MANTRAGFTAKHRRQASRDALCCSVFGASKSAQHQDFAPAERTGRGDNCPDAPISDTVDFPCIDRLCDAVAATMTSQLPCELRH